LRKFVTEAHDVGSHNVDLATHVLSNEFRLTRQKRQCSSTFKSYENDVP